MSSRAVALASLLASAAAGCGDTALVLELSSDLSTPDELDGVCVSVAAVGAGPDDEVFARHYRLGGDGEPTGWPQSLTVLPGDHDEVQVWARGGRDGLELVRAGARVSFVEGEVRDVALDLSSCPDGGGSLAPRVAGSAEAAGARSIAAAVGWRGVSVVVADDGGVRRFVAGPDGLTLAPDTLAAAADARLISADIDGDCDDDLLVGSSGETAVLRQNGDGTFSDAGVIDGASDSRMIAADVDGDGDLDVIAGNNQSRLYVNDGTGRFQLDAAAIPADAGVVRALAAGDVNGDGAVDLLAAIDGGGVRLYLNDAAGTGAFEPANGALPATPVDGTAMVAADLDADGDVDVAVGQQGAPMRLWINRGGLLEDRSFDRLPALGDLDVTALSAADLDGDCLAELLITRAGAAPILLRGTDPGDLEEVTLPGGIGAATTGMIADADGDGGRDLLLAGPTQGVAWIAPR